MACGARHRRRTRSPGYILVLYNVNKHRRYDFGLKSIVSIPVTLLFGLFVCIQRFNAASRPALARPGLFSELVAEQTPGEFDLNA